MVGDGRGKREGGRDFLSASRETFGKKIFLLQ